MNPDGPSPVRSGGRWGRLVESAQVSSPRCEPANARLSNPVQTGPPSDLAQDRRRPQTTGSQPNCVPPAATPSARRCVRHEGCHPCAGVGLEGSPKAVQGFGPCQDAQYAFDRRPMSRAGEGLTSRPPAQCTPVVETTGSRRNTRARGRSRRRCLDGRPGALSTYSFERRHGSK